MDKMPFIRHPWYPQSAYMFRRARLHAPVPDPMGAFGEDYTYGSFSSRTPYAFVPRHTGLEGTWSDVGVETADPCGVSAAKRWLVEKVTSVAPLSAAMNIPFAGDAIRKAIGDALDAGIAGLLSAASQGRDALSGYFASNMATPIATALKNAMSKVGAGSYAPSGAALANLFNGLSGDLITWLQNCAQQPTTPTTPTTPTPNLPTGTPLPYFSNLTAAPGPSASASHALLYPGDDSGALLRYGQMRQGTIIPGIDDATTGAGAGATGGAGGVAVVGGLALLALLLLR